MNIPPPPIQAGNVLANLHAGKTLVDAAATVRILRECTIRNETHTLIVKNSSIAVSGEFVIHFATHAANPDTATRLIRLRITGSGDESAALLGLKGSIEVPQSASDSTRGSRNRARIVREQIRENISLDTANGTLRERAGRPREG